jgi:hypothetical protein
MELPWITFIFGTDEPSSSCIILGSTNHPGLELRRTIQEVPEKSVAIASRLYLIKFS